MDLSQCGNQGLDKEAESEKDKKVTFVNSAIPIFAKNLSIIGVIEDDLLQIPALTLTAWQWLLVFCTSVDASFLKVCSEGMLPFKSNFNTCHFTFRETIQEVM